MKNHACSDTLRSELSRGKSTSTYSRRISENTVEKPSQLGKNVSLYVTIMSFPHFCTLETGSAWFSTKALVSILLLQEELT